MDLFDKLAKWMTESEDTHEFNFNGHINDLVIVHCGRLYKNILFRGTKEELEIFLNKELGL